jgi:hypothetical protein
MMGGGLVDEIQRARNVVHCDGRVRLANNAIAEWTYRILKPWLLLRLDWERETKQPLDLALLSDLEATQALGAFPLDFPLSWLQPTTRLCCVG